MKLELRLGMTIAALLAATPALAETRTFDVDVFHAVDVGTGLDLIIEVGPDQSVSITQDEGDFDRARVRVENGELRINTKGVSLFGRGPKFTAVVTMPHLDSLEISTGASADVTRVNAENFDIEVSTGGEAELAGTCGHLDAELSTGAELNARGLECESVYIELSTGAQATVFASEKLEADVSTGGDLDVYGHPKEVDTDTWVGGDVDLHN